MPFPRSTRSDMEKPGRMRCAPADSPKVGGHPGIPCRKGQAPSLRGGACEFAQSCGERGDSCAARRGRRALRGLRIRPGSADSGAFPAGRGKPLPYGEALANSPKVAENGGIAARRAGVGAPYRGLRIRLTGCFGSVLLRGTPRTAFPTGLVRIRRRLNQVADVCCRPSRTPPPTRPLRVPHFLPPAGEGGIRRSPARRMTEEGEPDRLQTVQSFAYFPPLRSFPHCGPVTFSLSGRPCGRHPPPLGEGRGEGALDERHVRQIRRPSHCRGRRPARGRFRSGRETSCTTSGEIAFTMVARVLDPEQRV